MKAILPNKEHATQRNAPAELSRQQIQDKTMLSEYKAGYTFYQVTSNFKGNEELEDLYYQIILNRASETQNKTVKNHDI